MTKEIFIFSLATTKCAIGMFLKDKYIFYTGLTLFICGTLNACTSMICNAIILKG